EIRKVVLVALDALPLSFTVSGAQVGVINHLQAARAAKLHEFSLTGERVFHLGFTPPPFLHQQGSQIFTKLLKGYSPCQRPINCFADIAQDVELHGLGYRERSLVLLLPDIFPTEADQVAFLAEEFDSL